MEENFEIYWDNLNEDTQNMLYKFLGQENGNFDTIPIATIEKNK